MSTFKITTVGAAAAAGTGNPNGLAVEITTFRVGSSFGYTPEASQTALRGNTLYQGQVSAIRQHSPDTKAVIIEIPTTAGPWEFGEIGLYLKTGELYAVMAFKRPIPKLSVLVDGVPHAPVFHCLMKLGPGGNASFTLVDGPSGSNLLELLSFSYVTAPMWMPNLPNAIIVHEGTLPAVLLYKNTSHTWVPAGYDYIGSFTGTMPNSTTVSAAFLNDQTSSLYGDVLIQDQWGRIRYTSYISNGSAVLSAAVPVTPGFPSTEFTLFRKSASVFGGGGTNEPGDSGNVGFLTRSEALWMWTMVNSLTSSSNSNVNVRGGLGLNLADVPLPTGDVPTDGEWAALTLRVNRAREHISSPVDGATSIALVAPSRTNPIMYGSRVGALRQSILNIGPYLRKPTGFFEEVVQVAQTKVMTTPTDWKSARVDLRFTWSSLANANTFFNSGGYIDIRVRSGKRTYLEWMIFRALSQLGSIRFGAETVETTGPQRLVFEKGDGVLTPTGPLGWTGLAEDRVRNVFAYAIPIVGSETLAGNAPGNVGARQPADEHVLLNLYAVPIANGLFLSFTYAYTGFDDEFTTTSWATAVSGDPLTNGYDEPERGVTPATWWSDQRLNFYAITGRKSNSPLITPPWPTTVVETVTTAWGVPMSPSDPGVGGMASTGTARSYWGTRTY